MTDPIITRCQCRPGCRIWVRLDRDGKGLRERRLIIVHPSHARPDHRLREARPGYVVAHAHR